MHVPIAPVRSVRSAAGKREPEGGGGAGLSPSPPPGLGQPPAWEADPRWPEPPRFRWTGCVWYFWPPAAPHPVDVRSVRASLRAPAAAAERRSDSPGLRNGLSGGFGNGACCAGRRGPRRGGAGRIFGLSLWSPRPTGGALPRKEKRYSQDYLRHRAPLAWGSPFVHLAPLGRGSDFAFAARAARRGPLPASPVRKFPPLP